MQFYSGPLIHFLSGVDTEAAFNLPARVGHLFRVSF